MPAPTAEPSRQVENDAPGARRGLLIITLATLGVLLCGLLTEPRFNDGLWHMMVVRQWHETGRLPRHLELDGTPQGGEVPVGSDGVLWYALVTGASKLVGGLYPVTVQVLQAAIFAALLFSVYRLTRYWTDERTAVLGTILVGTMPVFLVCSVMCFLDPLAALFALWCLHAVARRRYVLSAFLAAGLWYSKQTGACLMPAYGLAVVMATREIKPRRRRILVVSGCALLSLGLISWDLHRKLFPKAGVTNAAASVVGSTSRPGCGPLPAPPPRGPLRFGELLDVVFEAKELQTYPRPSPLPIPESVQWLGGVWVAALLLGALGLRKLRVRTWWRRDEVRLSAAFTLFFLAFWLLLPMARASSRYLAVVLPIMTIGVAVCVGKIKSKALFTALAVASVLQYVAVLGMVYRNRQVRPDDREVLAFLEENAPTSHLILWEESSLGRWYLNRQVYWVRLPSPTTDEWQLSSVLRSENPAGRLRELDVRWVVVTKRLVYKFSGTYWSLGWPEQAVEALRRSEGVEVVLDNDSYTVMEVDPGQKGR